VGAKNRQPPGASTPDGGPRPERENLSREALAEIIRHQDVEVERQRVRSEQLREENERLTRRLFTYGKSISTHHLRHRLEMNGGLPVRHEGVTANQRLEFVPENGEARRY
jgi:hypothetical protein